MKIAWTSIYGAVYENDRCFIPDTCKIGENLLLPGITLKQELEKAGHEYHTIDQYNLKEIDAAVFSDIPDSLLTVKSWKDLIRYLVRKRWKKDWLLRVAFHLPKEKRILVIMEPPAAAPRSYQPEYHALFGKILTWNDDMLSDMKYHKFCYPQPFPKAGYHVSFYDKKMFVMICGNKSSNDPYELYSERRRVIEFFEDKDLGFDLYGFGWEKEGYRNYKGTTGQKLKVLSQYRFSICYENSCSLKGYITEKIFDCFFSGCIPVYWGACNVEDYIPQDCFIDRRKFASIQEVYDFTSRITEREYKNYLDRIGCFLNSRQFHDRFSVDAYVKKWMEVICGGENHSLQETECTRERKRS